MFTYKVFQSVKEFNTVGISILRGGKVIKQLVTELAEGEFEMEFFLPYSIGKRISESGNLYLSREEVEETIKCLKSDNRKYEVITKDFYGMKFRK